MTQAVRTLQVGKVGELVPRLDAPPKVKGEFAYASDLVVPGMLWGYTLRSPHPHARILSLDIAEAVSMPGVHADCHQISHWVGHAGLAYYKNDAGVALSHGAMTCNSGYYHGVMQLAFAGLPKPAVVRKARKLCTNPAINTSDRWCGNGAT